MLYGERAELYDRIYDFKDYRAEAEKVRGFLREAGVADGSRVLETACGTGNFLVHLRDWYDVSGSDLSDEMLAIARTKLGEMPLSRADFRDFAVDEPFDAVLLLFSSIGYAVTLEELRSTVRSMRRAVRPGGVAIVQPWIFPENALTGEPYLQTYEDDDLKLCRANITRHEDNVTILDFHWLVVRRDVGVEHFTEQHRLRLHSLEEMTAAFTDAGFEVSFDDEGRGTIIGRRG
ncbi:MAG: class I SAM-dependent methyltransferase [Planctomycetota bacterium]